MINDKKGDNKRSYGKSYLKVITPILLQLFVSGTRDQFCFDAFMKNRGNLFELYDLITNEGN